MLSAPSELAVYDPNALRCRPNPPKAVVFPTTAAELAAVVKIAERYDTAIVPRGADASECPLERDYLVLMLTRINALPQADSQEHSTLVTAGLNDLSRFMKIVPLENPIEVANCVPFSILGNDSETENLLAEVSRDLFSYCNGCGICLSACPTYLETGDENDSPRGRIKIMRLLVEGQWKLNDRMRRHLDRCLDCRACEAVCPSEVQYGQMIESFRAAVYLSENRPELRYDWFREIILFRILTSSERIRRLLAPIRFLQHMGLYDAADRLGLLNLIPGRFGRLMRLIPPPVKQGRRLPKFLPAVGRKRARVAFFVGCAADALFRHVHWATLRVLQQNGCDICIPPEQGCCGALRYHLGDSRGARQLADANLVAFQLDRYDAILVSHGACGAMLKEYGVHWKDG
ncbi:MAG: 4Fe-4S dicluster domain-containing protein, partial [Thermoguttaceae bacterium]